MTLVPHVAAPGLASVNDELRTRNRQLAAVAALGQAAIRARDLTALMDESVVVAARTLGTEFAVVAESLPDREHFLVRAGVGWKDGIVGHSNSGRGTPAEYLLRSNEPVVIPDVSLETRFPIPSPMLAHGVASAMYVIIRGRERLWGMLSVYAKQARSFSTDDVGFLQSVANVLALAVERDEVEVAQRREKEVLESIFENIPVLISFYDATGKLLRVNKAWEQTLGWTLEEARSVDFLSQLYPDPERRAHVVEFMRRADRRWEDFTARARDGGVIETSWTRFALSDGTRLGFGLDLTERKRAAQALAESEARFARIFQISPAALAMSTIDEGRILDVNEAWLEMFGYRRDEVVGRTNLDLNLSVDRDVRAATVEQVRRQGAARNLEMQVRRKSGEVLDLLVSAVAVDVAEQRRVWITALVDITGRKRAEAERGLLLENARAARERLATLSRRLLSAHEEERQRLAVELHDELGQVLTAVKINLESLGRASGQDARLRDAISSVDQAMERVRDIALALRPSVLDDLGLPAALRWYLDRFARAANLDVHVSIDAMPELEAGLETACFRVAQEALTNVARHAQARRVWLDLHLLADGLELRVRDDGVGFDFAAARQRAIHGASLGLLGMQERVTLAGGSFEISSAPPDGTEVRARFPTSGTERGLS